MELVRLEGTDPLLDEPFVDADEPLTVTDPATGVTVDCRRVGGGFRGTAARFALYFPAADAYLGRFFQHTYPTLTDEELGPSHVVFAVSHGAYAVSTNNAGGIAVAPDGVAAFRVNAAAARASRRIAAEIYGSIGRPRGYLFGASGGAYQTLGAMQGTVGVWDGAVAMVPGTPNAIPSAQAAQALGLRVLKDVLPQIADAVAPGGSGDPYAGLDDEQAQVLREVTRFGFPLRGWWQHATLTGGSFSAVAPTVQLLDPTYLEDFWTTPGYEGTDPSSSVQAARVEGDADRDWELALGYYFRHAVPADRQRGWEQYRDPDGTPIHPQRPRLVGPILARSTAGVELDGTFRGKVVLLGSTLDVEAYPWMADWHARKAAAADPDGDRFRIWFTENADHDAPKSTAAEAHVVSYTPSLERALLDLDRWVADGVPPARSSVYEIGADSEIVLASTATGRAGVQPVIRAAVDGSDRADVATGTEVELTVDAEVPPDTGELCSIEWDFAGTGNYPDFDAVTGTSVSMRRTHAYAEAGTYFATARVTAQRTGAGDDPYGRVQNLTSVRIVVS